MLVRNYESRHLEALKAMHADQGVDYDWPDIERPEFFSKLVIEDSEGKAVMAIMAKRACEVHFLVDHNYLTPAMRLELLLWLHREAVRDITSKGVFDGFCFMKKTPKLKRFAKRLVESLGWNRQDTVTALWFERKAPNGK